MTRRATLEGQIATGLEEVKGLQSGLNRRFRSLGTASRQAHISFLLNLIDLQERARWLEGLVDALDDSAHR